MSTPAPIDESDAAPLWIELRQVGGEVIRVAIRGPDDTRRLVELIASPREHRPPGAERDDLAGRRVDRPAHEERPVARVESVQNGNHH